ncbi:hypothetical protein GXW82_22560 [Streptacidiphilus sp. 4-A2]|nr:hypothetical protein [Streptacidiphilus sp. 4-A2]
MLLVSGVLAVGGILLPSIQQQGSHGDTRILKVVVNGGQPIVLGASGSSPISFQITAEDKSGIRSVDNIGLWSANYGILTPSEATCKATSGTVSVCTGTSSVSVPKRQIYDNMAGSWYVQATAHANDGDKRTEDKAGRFKILKQVTATIYGVTAPVAKGAAFTVDGQLLKPDWRSQQLVANNGTKALLEFCVQPDCTKWKVVGSAKSNGSGNLTETVRAQQTGNYMWVSPATFWSAAATSQPMWVEVNS